jgi:DNA invertase Pin-like site-specific DNA recombinase
MDVVAYIVSGAPDLAAGEDNAAQRSQVERWAARRKATVRGWYEDHEVGVGPLFKSRPALMEALSVLRDGDAEALLLTTRDWLDAHEQAIVEGLARRAEGTVIAIDGSRPSAAVERLVETCEAYARALTSVGTRAKRRAHQARGAPYGQVPWGFRASADGTRVVRDKDEQRVLSLVAHMRASGFKLREIAAELSKTGLRTRPGGPITIARISELLHDIDERPLYEEHREAIARKQRS